MKHGHEGGLPITTPKWPKPTGSKGPRFNKAGFPEIQAYAVQYLNDDRGSRVSKKISKLKHEGKPQDQAVATAINMEKEHRLTESGGYKRKK